jgi:hypothetical protein
VVILLILLGIAAAAVVCTLIFVVVVDRTVARPRSENEGEKGEEPENEKS